MENLGYNKYAVVGACGFIGSHIVEELVNQGKHVIAIDNLVSGKVLNIQPSIDTGLCDFYYRDVIDYHNMEKLFKDVDIVFHNAASKCTVCRVDPKFDLLSNAIGTLNVCKASYEHGVKKVIHASTGSVANNNPQSYYGVSKLAAENYISVFKNYYPKFNYTILRYYHVYGSRQDDSNKGGVIPIFISQAYNNYPITIDGDGKQVRHFTTVDDIVKANFFCVNNSETNNQTYDVVSNVKITILELAKMITSMVGANKKMYFYPEKQGDIKQFDTDNSALVSLGFKFNDDFKGELLKTVNWYKDECSLPTRQGI